MEISPRLIVIVLFVLFVAWMIWLAVKRKRL
jgi:hypothetical protein